MPWSKPMLDLGKMEVSWWEGISINCVVGYMMQWKLWAGPEPLIYGGPRSSKTTPGKGNCTHSFLEFLNKPENNPWGRDGTCPVLLAHWRWTQCKKSGIWLMSLPQSFSEIKVILSWGWMPRVSLSSAEEARVPSFKKTFRLAYMLYYVVNSKQALEYVHGKMNETRRSLEERVAEEDVRLWSSKHILGALDFIYWRGLPHTTIVWHTPLREIIFISPWYAAFCLKGFLLSYSTDILWYVPGQKLDHSAVGWNSNGQVNHCKDWHPLQSWQGTLHALSSFHQSRRQRLRKPPSHIWKDLRSHSLVMCLFSHGYCVTGILCSFIHLSSHYSKMYLRW